jgi:heme-degrading monooxygenase HmoA
MTRIATTPAPPYYAVIAPSEFSDDVRGYQEMATALIELAEKQPGFLGIEVSIMGNFGMAVSYWESLEAIDGWRKHAGHLAAKSAGKTRFFSRYFTRIAKVEADY